MQFVTSLQQRPVAAGRAWGRGLGKVLAGALLGLGAVLSWPAAAQYEAVPQIASERDNVVDLPGRTARLAELQGSVWLFHPEAGDWQSAERNRPLTTGDRLSTDGDGRVELWVGSTSIRLDRNTEVELVRVDDEAIEVYLHSGSLAARVRSNESARELVLSTDEGRFTPQRSGRLRLDRTPDLSQVTVSTGQVLYEGPESALNVEAGQRADFWLDGSRRAQYSLGAPRVDSFAAWAAEMDRPEPRSASSRYVSPEMTGAEDLDRYGRWEQDPEYGALWTPTQVGADWAPYAAGHWTWVSPWGWTWVDDAPWGFAPFHYGRWVFARERWCWAPGRYVARPVYAPALVGWVGGGGASVSIGIGGGPAVGWFPLAPREAWVPNRRVSPRYVRVVNGPHFRNGQDIERLIQNPLPVLRGTEYRNRNFNHGTSGAPLQAFQQQPGRYSPVVPQWRGGNSARNFDRLPATPVGVVAPPSWQRPVVELRRDGRDAGWRREGRDDRAGRGPVVVGTPPPARPGDWQGQRGEDRTVDRPIGRPTGRPMDPQPDQGARPFYRDGEPRIERNPERSPDRIGPEWRAPAPVMQPPQPRAEPPPADPRFNRPQRPDRGEDRGGRGPDRAPPSVPAAPAAASPSAASPHGACAGGRRPASGTGTVTGTGGARSVVRAAPQDGCRHLHQAAIPENATGSASVSRGSTPRARAASRSDQPSIGLSTAQTLSRITG